MEALFILIGFSVCVAVLFLFFFIRSVKDGQYDDDTSPAIRILDKPMAKTNSENLNKSSNN